MRAVFGSRRPPIGDSLRAPACARSRVERRTRRVSPPGRPWAGACERASAPRDRPVDEVLFEHIRRRREDPHSKERGRRSVPCSAGARRRWLANERPRAPRRAADRCSRRRSRDDRDSLLMGGRAATAPTRTSWRASRRRCGGGRPRTSRPSARRRCASSVIVIARAPPDGADGGRRLPAGRPGSRSRPASTCITAARRLPRPARLSRPGVSSRTHGHIHLDARSRRRPSLLGASFAMFDDEDRARDDPVPVAAAAGAPGVRAAA